MMDVVFYDRKHKCEVKASQLVRTRCIAEFLQGDSQDPPKSFDDLEPEILDGHPYPGRLAFHEVVLGELAYKTPACPSYQNWDRHLMESDLVFLRLEEAPE